MLIFYKAIINLVYAIIWPFIRLKAAFGDVAWRERLCLRPHEFIPAQDTGRQSLWVHASSVGEVRVMTRLIDALKIENPDVAMYISTYTRTGQALAKELFPDDATVFYFPLDCAFPLRRLFNHFTPAGIVIVETEIWPGLLDRCIKRRVPVFLANGRVSERSYARYRKFRGTLAKLLTAYRGFAMQTAGDKERIIGIGAIAGRVRVLGNIKHDPDLNGDKTALREEVRRNLNIAPGKLFVIAASTRPGEEEIICRALNDCSEFPDRMVIMLAPRHLERLEEVKTILDMHGLSFGLYSELEPKGKTANIILMDKMGFLTGLFYGADIAFVGGTLVDIGGHNIMEPVVAGVPVLFGPSLYNVQEAADKILERGQGAQVRDAAELQNILHDFASGSLTFTMEITPGTLVAEQTARMIIKEFEL